MKLNRGHKAIFLYSLKFLVIFCCLYYGTLGIIGLAAPGGLYSPFIESYLDYVSWIKKSLMMAVSLILGIFDIPTHFEPGFLVRMTGGRGVIIAMSCVGFGVYSFWTAFVAANQGGFLKKVLWIAGGVSLLWLINVLRITLFLLAINKGWPMPLGLDHHTWFNIFAYSLIFALIFFYGKRDQKREPESKHAAPAVI